MAGQLPVAKQCVCVVGGPIDIIGKKWTMCIVVTLGNKPGIRFNELLDGLGGISPRTLSETLKALEMEGILEREAFREIPPRVEYRLTRDGAKLREAVKPLMEWAAGRPGAVCQPARTRSGGQLAVASYLRHHLRDGPLASCSHADAQF